ncbi:MAG: hypothetical protein Q8N98_03050 [bacterium]|nr:hypothetical protein [bacterium]
MLTLLITRPRYEATTFYLFAWSKKIIEVAIAKNLNVIDLKENRVNKKELTSVIEKTKPELIVLNGHGDADLITGQNGEVLIKVGENEELLAGKIIYVLSCKTAQLLGLRSVAKGTKCYIGYKEEFLFVHKNLTKPLDDPWAGLFFEPSNQIPISLIKQHTSGEASEKAKNMYLKNIQQLIVNNSPDSFLIPHLLWDMQYLTCIGNQSSVA